MHESSSVRGAALAKHPRNVAAMIERRRVQSNLDDTIDHLVDAPFLLDLEMAAAILMKRELLNAHLYTAANRQQ